MTDELKLTVKAVTWSRDSHGLYDYESKHIIKKVLHISNPSFLARSGTEICHLNSHPATPEGEDSSTLCKITKSCNRFSVKPCTEPIWMVVRTMQNHLGGGFIAKQGDVIKLGRVCLTVTLLSGLNPAEAELNTQESEELELDIPNERDLAMCRICLNNDTEEGNPLISPCSCSGSMKYIHLLCLRRWIDSRMVVRTTENCTTYSWKSMDCEICKKLFPLTGKSDLIKLPKPDCPFLVLEGVGNDKNSNRGVQLIAITGKGSIIVGRGHDVDVRVSDISVSRSHATIKFIDGEFVIEDNHSKFGTLVRTGEELVIQEASAAVIQIGRTVFSLSTIEQSSDKL